MNTAEKYMHDKFSIGNNEHEVKIITETMMPHMKAMALEFYLKAIKKERYYELSETDIENNIEIFEDYWNFDLKKIENPDFKGFNYTGLQG